MSCTSLLSKAPAIAEWPGLGVNPQLIWLFWGLGEEIAWPNQARQEQAIQTAAVVARQQIGESIHSAGVLDLTRGV